MTEAASPAAPSAVEGILSALAQVAGRSGREDLSGRLAAARARINRPDTVVAVVGEFKQGKSSIVNSLLGEDLCPVDDDLATAALTLIRSGGPAATAWREENRTYVPEAFDLATLPALVTEQANPDNWRRVALVDVQMTNGFLSNGIALADTPGVGGLSLGYMGLTLAYLQSADALLFVSDASSPLTASEVEFLRRAQEACPTAIVVLSKCDLFPDWRRVLEIDRATLASEGIEAPAIFVSSALRGEAFRRGDATLNEESGYPELLDLLAREVLDPSRGRAAARALSEARFVVAQLQAPLGAEEAGLEDREAAKRALEQLQAQQERLDRLRLGSARWQMMMNDKFGDLVADAEHAFRQKVRSVGRDADETLEKTDPGDTWDDVAARIRETMAGAVSHLIRDLEAGADKIALEIVELLREEDLHMEGALGRATPTDVARLWSGAGPGGQWIGEAGATTWATMRGAQGGILVFGMLGGLAGVALSGGMLIGIGALFGGKGLFEERKKQVTQRRQKARNAVRQFLDDVQFETGKSMRDLSRELQRHLRDHFSQRISERVRTCAATTERLQRSLQQDESARGARLAAVRKDLEALESLEREMAAAGQNG